MATDPKSDEWWQDRTMELMQADEAHNQAYWEAVTDIAGNQATRMAAQHQRNRTKLAYYGQLLLLYREHRPNGPKQGERLPPEVREAMEASK